MRTDQQPGPDDGVGDPAAAWPLAVLLTDDRAEAEELVVRALAGRRRDRRSPGPAVVRAAVRQDRTDPAPGPRGRALDDALRALPRRTRALAVVHLLDPSSGAAVPATPDEVAGAVAALRRELDRADERDRAQQERDAAPFLAPRSTWRAPEPDRTPLPDRLRALAARVPLTPDQAAALLAEAGGRRRSHRRTGLRVLAAVLALAVLAVLAVVVPRGGQPPEPAAAADGPDVYAGPPRGSLAGDAAFLDGIRAQTWSGTDLATQPPPADRRGVWAGEVDGVRAALLISGEGTGDVATAWFTGPAGAPAGQLRLQAVHPRPDPQLPAALLAPVRGALVVVGAPGDRVQVSTRADFGADGTSTRTFYPADVDLGVATFGLPRSTPGADPAVRYRVLRDGRQLPAGPLDTAVEPDPGPAVLPRLRPAPAPAAGDAVVDAATRDLLARLGQRADTSGTTVLWSGDLPGPESGSTRVGVVAVPQPAGSVVVAAFTGTGTDPGDAACATGVLRAGPPLDQRVVVLGCDLGGRSRLLVVAPRGADQLRLRDTRGVVVEQRPMDDGFAVVTSPTRIADVEVTTADGRVLAGDPVGPLDLTD